LQSDSRWCHFFAQHLTLLEDEEATLASLGFRDNDQLLIEVRNKDLTWPEEMVSLTGQSGDKYRQG
jgi:ubiquitin carboxyl-terminal hydrolase 6/32